MLPKEAVAEYKVIYQKVFGVMLTDEEASFRANNLINLYRAVYNRPSLGTVDRRDHGRA